MKQLIFKLVRYQASIVKVLHKQCKYFVSRQALSVVFQVKLKSDDTKTFALKCLAKKHIVNTCQQEHIFSEKKVQSQVHCHFVAQ